MLPLEIISRPSVVTHTVSRGDPILWFCCCCGSTPSFSLYSELEGCSSPNIAPLGLCNSPLHRENRQWVAEVEVLDSRWWFRPWSGIVWGCVMLFDHSLTMDWLRSFFCFSVAIEENVTILAHLYNVIRYWWQNILLTEPIYKQNSYCSRQYRRWFSYDAKMLFRYTYYIIF